MNLNESLKGVAGSGAMWTKRLLAFAHGEMKAFLVCALGCYLGFIVLFLLKSDPETATFGDFLRVIHSSSNIVASFIAAALSIVLRRLFPRK
jgi:hypothetical protein